MDILFLIVSTGGYNLRGILKVATQQATGVSSQIYQVFGNFDTFETFQEPGRLTYFLTGGDLKMGIGSAFANGGV